MELAKNKYKFSKKSLKKLETCHNDLQLICKEVIKDFDFTVLEGYRSVAMQKIYKRKGLTHTLKSKHNMSPSYAVDIAPYPIDWNDKNRFYYLAGLIKATASQYDINIRWGGDWNNNNDFTDQKFFDLVHFELI